MSALDPGKGQCRDTAQACRAGPISSSSLALEFPQHALEARWITYPQLTALPSGHRIRGHTGNAS
jgi:hypothetical protein